jgi:hypothetical protein
MMDEGGIAHASPRSRTRRPTWKKTRNRFNEGSNEFHGFMIEQDGDNVVVPLGGYVPEHREKEFSIALASSPTGEADGSDKADAGRRAAVRRSSIGASETNTVVQH